MQPGISSWELSPYCWLGLWGMPTTPSTDQYCLSITCHVPCFVVGCSLLQRLWHFCHWCFQSFTTRCTREPIPEAGKSIRMKALAWGRLIYHNKSSTSGEPKNSGRFSYNRIWSLDFMLGKTGITKYQLVAKLWICKVVADIYHICFGFKLWTPRFIAYWILDHSLTHKLPIYYCCYYYYLGI